MTISLQLPKRDTLNPVITVFGVGGAGGNAVSNMIQAKLEGINFVIANTDAQALAEARTDKRIQLGETITQGLGAGSYPEVGKAAAEEAIDQIHDFLQGSNMVFVTAGMGGGTGTGASPVIARLAREQGILTVGVVTKPFHFEGAHRMRVAELGLQELEKYVDTLIVIPNQNLFRIADKSTTFADAFKMADQVLHSGVRGITDLMIMPGLINLDFADVRAVMSEMGKAMMGTGEGEGDRRAVDAAEAAISNPLLDNVSMKGARGVLINITGGPDMTLFEVDEAANRIREEVDPDANIIFGSTFNDGMTGKMRVSVVATGIEAQPAKQESSKFYTAGASEAEAAQEINREDESFIRPTATRRAPVFQTGLFPASALAEEEMPSREDVFVSPEPEEPSRIRISPAISGKEADESADQAETALAREEVPLQAPGGRTRLFNLFGRKAEPTPPAQERITPPLQKQEPANNSEKAEERQEELVGAGAPTEEDLDIPAFLRRRSN